MVSEQVISTQVLLTVGVNCALYLLIHRQARASHRAPQGKALVAAKTWWSEIHPQDPHSQRRGETPEKCSLTTACASWQVHSPAATPPPPHPPYTQTHKVRVRDFQRLGWCRKCNAIHLANTGIAFSISSLGFLHRVHMRPRMRNIFYFSAGCNRPNSFNIDISIHFKKITYNHLSVIQKWPTLGSQEVTVPIGSAMNIVNLTTNG